MDLRPTLDPVDEELNQFERDIRQLKIEYEQFFGGGKKRPPADIEWRIDLMIKRYGDRGAAMNYGQRFRYSNLLQTYVQVSRYFPQADAQAGRGQRAAPFRRRGPRRGGRTRR